MPLVSVHQSAVDLIMEFEGLRLNAYVDPATGGEPITIGYGHTSAAGAPVVKLGMKITEAEAETILKRDLQKFADGVFKMLTAPVNPYQFGAMTSLSFNIGLGNFGKSTLLKKVNAGDFEGAAAQFARWNKANKKVMAGLTRRRAAEAALFMRPTELKPAPVTPPKPAEWEPANPNVPKMEPEAKPNSAGWIVLGATAVSGALIAAWDWIVAVTGYVSPWW